MKIKNEQKYYIQSRNLHLMNVLERDYYIELGSIYMNKLQRILKGDKTNLIDIVDLELLSEGVGKITADPIADVYYQLNYLINLRLKNSTCKFMLTAGTVKYLDDSGCEKYAPVVLIPFDFDYQHLDILISGTPIINPLLVRHMSKYLVTNKLSEKRFAETYKNVRINSIYDIDKICIEVSKDLDSPVEPINYFTIAFVEYPDIVLEKDYMSIDRSINEMTELAIMEKYYKEIKGVLPTNINQKYVILKASDGDKFAVNGKLGSGKTYTILNIIADQITKGKRILYVNQDLDNIIDIEKNLSYIGLLNQTYNLTKNLREIENGVITSEDVDISDVSPTIIQDIFKLPQIFQKRVHGYNIRTIFEKLAILKRENKNIKRINLETKLEYHEANQILEELESVEKSLAEIDLYANNIWHRLQISHNNISKDEIINRIKELSRVHEELNKYLAKHVKKYNLKMPNNISEMYKEILDVYSFATVRPLAKWKQESTRREILKHLREIQGLVDINYAVNQYYQAHINKTYTSGRMQEIFNTITAKHIKVDENYESQDAIFVNKLIAFNSKLSQLIAQIDENVSGMDTIRKKLLELFSLNSVNNHIYNFFTSFNAFLTNNKQYVEIYEAYINTQSIFTKYADEIVEAIKKINELEAFLPLYVNHFNIINLDDIATCMTKRNPDKALTSFVNTRNVKKDNKNTKEITDNLKVYYDAKKKVSDNLTTLFNREHFTENFIASFINFYQFASGLNVYEKTYFKSFLDNLSQNNTYDTYINEVKNCLNAFKDEGYRITSICTELLTYGVNISNENVFEKVNKLKEYNRYFKQVNILKEEIKGIYKDLEVVTYKDLVELIKCDEQYQQVQETLQDRAADYKKTIGKYYNGLDTIINEVGITIAHYEDFLKCLNNPAMVDELFEPKLFDELLADTRKLDNIYSQWSAAYRTFSVCFKGSQPEMLTNSFNINTKLFKQFIDKSNQIEPILNINSLTEGFLEYGLKDLYEGIRSCKYGIGISKNFIYSVLYNNYEEVLKLYPELKDMNHFTNDMNDYIRYEIAYCQKNLLALSKYSLETDKNIIYNHGIEFNNYNKVVKVMNKYAKIFLSDLDIFNSNLNLESFDLVILDDVHLSSSNKYNRLCECKQVIAFGDKTFQTSVSNALMKRLGDICTVTYKRRYISSDAKSNNTWDYDNQYVYSYANKYNIIMSESFDAFMNDIFEKFKKDTTHIINILVGSEETRREIYTAIVRKLTNAFTVEEIINILCYKIRILNAFTEGNRYVNDIYIYFEDFKDVELSERERIFKNFIAAHNSINIYYIQHKLDVENQKTKSMIQETIGKPIFNVGEPTGIVALLKNDLITNGLKIDNGFGCFDLIIKGSKPTGIMIIGKDNDNLVTFVDDYKYYHDEYAKRGWNILKIYILDLFDNYDKAIKTIVKEVQ